MMDATRWGLDLNCKASRAEKCHSQGSLPDVRRSPGYRCFPAGLARVEFRKPPPLAALAKGYSISLPMSVG